MDLNNSNANISENNKRIAKNTALLYIRMLLTMLISLYTSRVVLNALGVEDFGIYNIVGSLVMMFNFLNSSMSIAVQRYLSFEIGRGNWNRLNHIFSLSLVIHIILAVIIVIVAGSIGYWLISTQLKIPHERLSAAIWVFGFSILGCCANIIRIPYNAIIIAREKMDMYAYISILEVILNLGVAYLLIVIVSDKLKLYAILVCIVNCIITWYYQFYCKIKFPESHYKPYWNKGLFKELVSFAGWSTMGEIAWVATIQGGNLLLNVFFGPVVNAARGISYQMTGAINRFVSSFQTAVNPQLIKCYSTNDKERMFFLLFRSTNFSFYLLLFFALPLIIETEEILKIWLKNVPEYTILFCRLAVINSLIDVLSNLLATAAKAYGRIRTYQMCVSLLLFMNLPLSYLVLKLGMAPQSVFYIYGIIAFLLLIIRIYLLHRMIDLPVVVFLRDILYIFPVTLIAMILPMIFHFEMSEGFIRLLVVTIVSTVSVAISVFLIGLKKNERSIVKNKILYYIKI